MHISFDFNWAQAVTWGDLMKVYALVFALNVVVGFIQAARKRR